MIPYSYNMVDMGGIDLAEANGTEVPGVYERITEAMNLCGDVILYNWKFAGISIVPSAYTILQQPGSILINGAIQVTELDQITIVGVSPEPPEPPTPAVLVPLVVRVNGDYDPADFQADGFSTVKVQVGAQVTVIPLEVTANGTYAAESPIDGFNPIEVSVPTVPVLTESEFNYLSKSQIQAMDNFGVIGAQGFECGTLYDGGEYHGIFQSQATGGTSASLLVSTPGVRNIFIMAINGEASTYDLNISLTINGIEKETSLLKFSSFSYSGDDRRNLRVVCAQEYLQVGDLIECSVSNASGYTSCVVAILRDFGTSIEKSISNYDSATTGSYELASMAIYGTADGYGPNKEVTLYSGYFEENSVVATPNPGTNYKSSFIFWVE